MQKNNSQERIIYLDIIKTLAIYFVCFYHFSDLSIDYIKTPSISTYLSYFIMGIASTGVPLFFMVNGALMLNKKFNLKKHCFKIINITLLTVIWGIITLVFLIPIKENSYSFIGFIKALWSWELGTINHLWFLQALVSLYLVFPLIKVVYDQKDKSILRYSFITIFILTFGNVIINISANVAESIFGINYLMDNNKNFFNGFNVYRGFYAYSIVYFILGAIILEKLKSNMVIKYKQLLIFFLFGMISLFGYGILMSYSNGGIFDTVWNGYDTVMTLFMCISIFILSFQVSQKLTKLPKLIQIIGTNTLGIYFLHMIVGSFLKPYYLSLSFSADLFANLVFIAIILLVSLVITIIIKKIPFLKLLFRI